MVSPTTILVVTLVALALVVVVVLAAGMRRSGAMAAASWSSKARSDQAMQLMHDGCKARATIVALQPTGMAVNDINLQCIVHFRLEPLGGGAPFDAQKKMLISQTAAPQVGDTWPSWFDPADETQFVVGQPTAITPEQVGLFRDFGIPHPLDRQVP